MLIRRTILTWMAPMAIVAIALAGAAGAQELPPEAEPPPEQPPEAEPPPETEMPPEAEMPGIAEPHPLVVLHAINQIQSQLGLMGVNEATNDDLREFASDLAERHNALDRDMLETANDMEIDVAGSGEVRMAMEMRLQNLDPQLHMLMEAPRPAFDSAFIELVVRSQEDAIETVQGLLEEAEQPQVREQMEQSLEAYQQHLQRAQQLEGELEEPNGEPDEAPDS